MSTPRSEFLTERLGDLELTLKSDGWRLVIKPILVERCQHIAGKLARGKRTPEPEMRALQAQFLLMEAMVDNPREFFGETIGEEADRRYPQ